MSMSNADREALESDVLKFSREFDSSLSLLKQSLGEVTFLDCLCIGPLTCLPDIKRRHGSTLRLNSAIPLRSNQIGEFTENSF